MTTTVKQFYRRVLPEQCIAFGSERGKRLFTKALHNGYMESYFGLAVQFRTQDEPAYCGLTTLVIVLNTLGVDPHRVWKGVWRWYHEDMLECCVPLEKIKTKGITFNEFICLACCNSLEVKATFVDDKVKLEDFREDVKRCCRSTNEIIVATYSRPVLGQTGTGHFSPLAGYDEEEDMVLILDTARFKYPPHWIKLELLLEAMKEQDPDSGLPRGYAVMKKVADSMQMHLFKVAPILCVLMNQDVNSNTFLKPWTGWLMSEFQESQSDASTWQEAICQLKNASKTVEGGLLTTQMNLACDSVKVSKEHSCAMKEILSGLESTALFSITGLFLEGEEKDSNSLHQVSKAKATEPESKPVAKPTNMTTLFTYTAIESNMPDKQQKGENPDIPIIDTKQANTDIPISNPNTQKQAEIQNEATSNPTTCTPCGSSFQIHEAHLVTMILLSWPYPKRSGTISERLAELKTEQLQKANNGLFQNEVLQLNRQLAAVFAHKAKCLDCSCH